MASINLKVTPDVLKSKATEIQKNVRDINKQWQTIETIIKNSKGYWEGDASQTHQQQYQLLKREVEEIVKRLDEHPVDLMTMAGVYLDAERKNEEVASSLPDDVIF